MAGWGDLSFVLPVLPVAAGLLILLSLREPRRLAHALVVVGAVLPLVLLYALNPAFRIYSRHGLLHASILYQGLEHGVPPPNPLLAGEGLGYHWGYDLLGAAFSRFLGVAPSWSYSTLNIVALTLVLLLLGRVSRDLVDRPARALLGPLVAVFAITPVPLWWLKQTAFSQQYFGPLMARATPVFHKFANVNGVPVGRACCALALTALGTCRRGGSRVAGRALLAASVTGCGLLYPPLLPGLLVTVGAFTAVYLIRSQAPDLATRVWAAALDAVVVAVGVVLAAGVLVVLGMRTATSVALLDTRFLTADVVSLLLTGLPMVVVIVAAWDGLRRHGDHLLIDQLLVAAAANAACFLAFSLTDRNEYKFLLLSQVLLGLVGGPALFALRRRIGFCAAAVTALVLLGSFVHIYENCFYRHRDAEVQLAEVGRRLVHPDPEQDQLYSWIGEHTPGSAALVDTEPLVTVLGPRAVLAPYRGGGRRRLLAERERGFVHRVDLFPTRFSGNDSGVVTTRRKLVQTLLDGGRNDVELARRLLREVGVSPVYVVCRSPAVKRRLARVGAEEVFRSDRGRVTVMRWSAPVG